MLSAIKVSCNKKPFTNLQAGSLAACLQILRIQGIQRVAQPVCCRMHDFCQGVRIWRNIFEIWQGYTLCLMQVGDRYSPIGATAGYFERLGAMVNILPAQVPHAPLAIDDAKAIFI